MDINMQQMMEKKWVQYLLYALLFLVIYFCFIRRKVLEAFDIDTSSIKKSDSSSSSDVDIQDVEEIVNNLKTATTKIGDGLHLDKYRKPMEDLVIDLNEWCGSKSAQLLPALAKKISNNSDGDITDIVKDIDNINKLNQFNASLNSIMRYIDKK